MELFVDSEAGDDAGDGSEKAPLQSVEMALKLSEKEDEVVLNFAPGKYVVPVEGVKRVNEIFSVPAKPNDPMPTESVEENRKRMDILAVRSSKDTVSYTEEERVMEPVGEAKGLSRVTAVVWVNKTIGLKVTEKRAYLNPPSSKAWCAEMGRELKVEKL